MKRLTRAAISVVVMVGLVAGVVLLVRDANGDYSGDYRLSGLFAKGGEGLPPGSEVVFRGVQVGRVASTTLEGDRARITVLMEPDFHVPRTATATVEPVNLFGADEVSLSTPGQRDDGPYLGPGDQFAHTANSDEVGDLFAAAAPLLNRVNTTNLATVLGELGRASQGEGPAIARSVRAGTQLAGELDETVNAQMVALNSFANFTQAMAPVAPDLNRVSDQVNAALPAFNSEERDYEKLLASVVPFSNDLASLLATYRPDIDTILASGDNVSRVLVTQQANIGQLVRGAYDYFRTIAEGAASQQKLPDGSTYAYFNTFIMFSDVNTLVCDLLAPAAPGLSYLQPIQQALAGSGSAFNCSQQLAAFNQAQGSAAPATTSPTAAASGAGQAASTQAFGIAGAPDTSTPTGLGGYISSLLGGSL